MGQGTISTECSLLARNTSLYNNSSGQDNSTCIGLLKDTSCRDMVVCEGRDEMQQDALDRIVEEWRQVRPDLDPSPLAVLGRLQAIGLEDAVGSTPSSSPMAWPGNCSMSWALCAVLVPRSSALRQPSTAPVCSRPGR